MKFLCLHESLGIQDPEADGLPRAQGWDAASVSNARHEGIVLLIDAYTRSTPSYTPGAISRA